MKKICRGEIYRVCLDPVQEGSSKILVVSSDCLNTDLKQNSLKERELIAKTLESRVFVQFQGIFIAPCL